MKHSSRSGFTLVNMLAAISIIIILSAVGFVSYREYGKKSRDTSRIANINNMKKALAIFYEQHGHYPPAGGTALSGFKYETVDAVGNCSINPNLRFDNGSSYPGIVESIADLVQPFQDPLNATQDSIYNCRYIIEATSADLLGGCPGDEPNGCFGCTNSSCAHPDTYKEIQSYAIHCALEEPNEFSTEDGGPGDEQHYFYEVFEPNPWLCIQLTPPDKYW